MLRFLIYSSVLILIHSCNDRNSQSQEVLAKFDSVNKGLEQTQFNPGDANAFIYDSLRKRMVGTDELAMLTRMKVSVGDLYASIDDLRKQFFTFCGDTGGDSLTAESADKIGLTNQFFIEQGYADHLYGQVRKVRENLPIRIVSAGDIKSLDDILEQGQKSNEPVTDFLNAWFKNVPPVAAVTVLNTFEFKVKSIESIVLSEYVKQYKIDLPEGAGAIKGKAEIGY